MKKVLSILLTLAMCLALLPVAAFAASEYTDTQGHWAEQAIDRWTGYGIVAGKGNGIFDPDGSLKRGEAAQIFANLFKLTAKADLSGYTDVGLGKWYDDAIAKCVKAGIMSGKGNGVMDPEGTLTREEFFVMLANALGIEPETTAADTTQASNWAAPFIAALANKGYIQDTDAAQPKENIDRAGVMSLLDKAITNYVDTTENVTVGDGLTLIVADNAKVSLKDSTGKADLYVFGDNAVITDAPAGTTVVTSEDATGTKVNGKAVSKDTTIVVEEEKSTGSDTPAETTYTVSFNMQGHGTTPAAINGLTYGAKITTNAAITTPGAVSADGCTFIGWYKEAECENEWIFDTDTVKKDTTLYAKWEGTTIAEILDTVSGGFPGQQNAWVADNNGNTCYISGSDLRFHNGDYGMDVPTSWPVTKDGDNYIYEGTYFKISFTMDGGSLISISWYSSDLYEDYNGTYTAPAVDKASYTLKEKDTWFTTLISETGINKSSVTDIIFCKEIPTGTMVVNGVDLTADTTGKVKGYIVEDGDNHKIYVVGDYIFGNEACSGMFNGFSNLATLDLSHFDTSNVTNMSGMFIQCAKLTSLDLSNFDTSNVTNMSSMFGLCSELTSLNLSKFDTSSVTNMAGMFTGCSSLVSIDLGKFNTGNVKSTSKMFVNCAKLASVKIETANDTIKEQLGEAWTYSSGAYIAQAPAAPLTIEFILDTYSDGLPIATVENTAPESGAWKTTDGKSCYCYGSNELVFNNNTDSVIWRNTSDTVWKSGDGYVHTSGDVKTTFGITDEKLTSITITGPEGSGVNYNGTYSAPAGNSNVFNYIDASTALDFTTGKYGDKTIASGNPIVINGITGNLSITGDTTGRELHAFVQTGGKVTSADSNGTIKAYIGGSEDALGTITAGSEDDANISLETDFINVDEIIANTTGKISIGVSDYTKKIDLGSVNANIEITTPLAHNVGTYVLQLDYSANGLFKTINSTDTLTYTAAADVKKVLGTAGNDIISMADNAVELIEIDLTTGGGSDTVIVNETLWKYDGSNLGNYKINVKSSDKVKIGNAASCNSTNVMVDSGTDVTTDNINTAINGNTSESGLFFFKFNFSTSGGSECYLIYDKDKNGSLSNGDIVIQIVGANSADIDAAGLVKFIG